MAITLEPDILQSIKELADEENRTPSEIVADALQIYEAQKNLPKNKEKMSDIEFLNAIAMVGPIVKTTKREK